MVELDCCRLFISYFKFVCSSWQESLSTGLSLFASASKIDDSAWKDLGLASLEWQVDIMKKLVEGTMTALATQMSSVKSQMGDLMAHFDFSTWDLEKFREETEQDVTLAKQRFEKLKEGVLA